MHTCVWALFITILGCGTAWADPYSATITGMKGLNTVPSARIGRAGDIRIGAGTLDPYVHGFIGLQVLDPLYVQIRQTAEVSSLQDDADRLYPGVDFKLRLSQEEQYRPAVVVGMQSAFGHKRMAGEFFAASKRYKDFDFTLGLGWGRYGTAGHFDNPFAFMGGHFDSKRNQNSQNPNGIEDWFTGKKVGVFGGVEYFTPIKGLSLKLDYGADRYSSEKLSSGYDAPAPWAIGANYAPVPWADFAFGMQGTDKVMARVNFNGMFKNWRNQSTYAQRNSPEISNDLPDKLDKKSIVQAALDEGMRVDYVAEKDGAIQAHVFLDPARSTPLQVKHAAHILVSHAPAHIDVIRITPVGHNLTTKTISLLRRDLIVNVPPQEMWAHSDMKAVKRPLMHQFKPPRSFRTIAKSLFARLDHQISLSEEDAGHLRRTSAVGGIKGYDMGRKGLLTAAVRLNIEDNLNQLNVSRNRSLLPVRSDVADFAENAINLDSFYQTVNTSVNEDVHIMARGGFLEEMYAGGGGEVLYRPFGKRFAIGAEGYYAFKRDPHAQFALGLNGDRVLTGFVNGWYDVPKHDVTAKLSLGRYLAEDVGGTLSLSKRFQNGASLSAFTTLTNAGDRDVFGGTTHAYHGIRMALPIGGYKYAPQNSSLYIKAEPFGRDTGQSLDMAGASLYDMTTPLSLPHIVQHWAQIK